MSKHKNQTKRYPLVEARLRLWLADQYRTRGLTGPWAINTRKVATDMGGFHGTIGAALAQFARMPNEGVVMISNGNYEYMPPRKPPTPSVLAGRTSSMAAPVRQAEPAAKPAPAEPRKPKRQLDMTLRPKLIQFARDTWRAKGEVTIVTYGSVAAALGTKPSSTGAAMLVLSKEYPEVGFVRIGGGVYEVHRPKRIRPVAQEPDERPEYEPEPEEPQHDAPPAQPEPQPGPAEPPPPLPPQPGPLERLAERTPGLELTPEGVRYTPPRPEQAIPAMAEEVMRRMAQNGRAPDWETVRKGENFAVLMDSDGGVWHARKLELS